MNILKTLLLLSLFSHALHCSQDTKQPILNAVTIIKPVQQIILGYLDIPDQLVHTFTGITQCSFAFSGTYAAIFSPGDQINHICIQIRETETGKLVKKMLLVDSPKGVYPETIAISSNSQYMGIQNYISNNLIVVYDIPTAKRIHLFQPQGYRGAVARNGIVFSPDSKLLASGMRYGKTVTLWELVQGKEMHSFSVETAYRPGLEYPLVFSADSKRIAIPGGYREFVIYTINSRELRKIKTERKTQFVSELESFNFSPDNRYLICRYELQRATELVDVATGIIVAVNTDNGIFTFAPSNNYIIFSGSKALQKMGDLPIMPLALNRKRNATPDFPCLQYLRTGALLVARFQKKPDIDYLEEYVEEIKIFKNQALDLDCPDATVTDIKQEHELIEAARDSQQSKSTCVIS